MPEKTEGYLGPLHRDQLPDQSSIGRWCQAAGGLSSDSLGLTPSASANRRMLSSNTPRDGMLSQTLGALNDASLARLVKTSCRESVTLEFNVKLAGV